MIWKCKSRTVSMDRPLLMGILNVTEDSFSDGGRFRDPERAVGRALEMEQAGADIIDIGAESTRPGAHPVPLEKELMRLLPVVRGIRSRSKVLISVDTTKPDAALRSIDSGADIVNDVSGLKDSGVRMAAVVRNSGAGLILMHRRGDPQTMQAQALYADPVAEVMRELRESMNFALEAGIPVEQLVVDPGIGFAKKLEHNLELLRHLHRFRGLGVPVLVGPSRKSFIGEITGRGVHERDYGTAAAVTAAVLQGVNIIRVHHTSAMRDVIAVAQALRREDHVGTFKMGVH